MRIIAHFDMDAFFAAVEERDNPRLAGRPIVVGSDPLGGRGRGVVSTANYAARAYGIRSALPISRAWRFSEDARRRGLPPAVFMAVDMARYGEASRRVMAVVRETLAHASGRPAILEQASVDEAYADISFAASYDRADELAREIKAAIRAGERLTASVGIGPNKLIAKIASDAKKPDGLTVVREEDAESFLAPMPLRAIPGVGPKTQASFAELGVETVADARRFTEPELYEMMGKSGLELYGKLRGRSDAPVSDQGELKSISEQTTFAHDVAVTTTREKKVLTDALAALARDVHARFVEESASSAAHETPFASFRSVGIMVRFADFTTKTRVATLRTLVKADDSQARRTIEFQSLRLFMPFLDRRENPARQAIRLLGVRIERLA